MIKFLCGCAIAALLPAAVLADTDDGVATAARFGARSFARDASLSPDGKHVALVVSYKDRGTAVMVADVGGGQGKFVASAEGNPNLTSCGWASNDRIVCGEYGMARAYNSLASFTRLVSMDAAGGDFKMLGRESSRDQTRPRQYDGNVLDWQSGIDGSVLMERDYVPENSVGTLVAETRNGLGVDRVDARTGKSTTIQPPMSWASHYLTDGQGHVRIATLNAERGSSYDRLLTGSTLYEYRVSGMPGWQQFSRHVNGDEELRPIAIDGTRNVAYALKKLGGRDALCRVKLDGSMAAELVYADPKVDVDDVITIGRSGRVIGFTYRTDRDKIEYFDPDYKALAQSLGRALPKLPLIRFISASADEQQLLIQAASDTDPGHYYAFDRTSKRLNELTPVRPDLGGITLSPVHSVSYRAADGTEIPAYLTLPPNGTGKGLPAIVMPHGGPESRDSWGFDWLAQFFAQRGYAVLQPEYRGSSGYGEDWLAQNGFKSWRTAIGDIDDGARWLAREGIADPGKLAIVGWSYGGYAALQSNVVDPSLFHAVVAIAPVTDLGMLKQQWLDYINYAVEAQRIGDGPQIADGSPARHVDRFVAPVLLFHGDQDLNVAVEQSRAMDAALRRAGKFSQLVVYPGLDHQIDDSKARTDMLAKADAFLRTNLKITTP